VLDLRHPALPDLHCDILLSTVRFAAAVGARLVVVHYEQRSDSPAIELQFRRAIDAAAEAAGPRHVTLGVENIEVERAERVLAYIDQVDAPHVRLTYDFGHDFLAAAHFGYDFLTSVRACAPYAAHAHCSDNFGRFDPARLGDFTLYKAIPQRNLNVSGLGDVHLPIGWGALPYDAAIAAFGAARHRPYDGILLGEHRRAFADADGEVLEHLRRFAQALDG
jgi:sugar phosphate isomerase/epimerase